MKRWRDHGDDGSPESRAGELLRSVRTATPTDALASRVQAVLQNEGRRPTRRPVPLLAALAVVLLFAGGAMAATLVIGSWTAPPPVAEAPPPQTMPTPPRVAPPPPPPTATPAPIPAAPPPPPPIRRTAKAPRTTAVDPSPLALESEVIKAAVTALREGRAEDALTRLAAYRETYPSGLLYREALLTQISALIALDRAPEALALLDRTPLDTHPRALELTVLRGELRAQSGRCSEAMEDFETALARGVEPRIATRAHAGMARCNRTP